MYPRISFGSIQMGTYDAALLAGIILGWFLFVLDEDGLWSSPDAAGRLKGFLGASLSYVVIVACCIQGAAWFHFLFDNIPPDVQGTLTLGKMVFVNPLKVSKVLYGAIFLFPVGVFLTSFWNIRGRFIPLLNRKTFVLFWVLAFARIGCFCNGCCYGVQSDILGMVFPMGSAAAAEHLQRGFTHGFVAPPSLPVIPTQAISVLVLFAFSFLAFRKARQGRARVFVTFVLYYALFRFLIEFLRDDLERAYFWMFSASQWISLFIFCVFGAWVLVGRARARG